MITWHIRTKIRNSNKILDEIGDIDGQKCQFGQNISWVPKTVNKRVASNQDFSLDERDHQTVFCPEAIPEMMYFVVSLARDSIIMC